MTLFAWSWGEKESEQKEINNLSHFPSFLSPFLCLSAWCLPTSIKSKATRERNTYSVKSYSEEGDVICVGNFLGFLNNDNGMINNFQTIFHNKLTRSQTMTNDVVKSIKFHPEKNKDQVAGMALEGSFQSNILASEKPHVHYPFRNISISSNLPSWKILTLSLFVWVSFSHSFFSWNCHYIIKRKRKRGKREIK